MMSGDEFYDDEVTSGPIDRLVARSEHPYECLASHIEYSLTDCTCCKRAGHIEGCPGNFGPPHVLLPGWIAYEDQDGSLIEIEVSGA